MTLEELYQAASEYRDELCPSCRADTAEGVAPHQDSFVEAVNLYSRLLADYNRRIWTCQQDRPRGHAIVVQAARLVHAMSRPQ